MEGDTLKAIVRPALWFMLSAAQFGPEYAEWFWPRIIDCLIRGWLAFFFACMAVKALRSNAEHKPRTVASRAPCSCSANNPIDRGESYGLDEIIEWASWVDRTEGTEVSSGEKAICVAHAILEAVEQYRPNAQIERLARSDNTLRSNVGQSS
jgi:hypothetical protein